MYKLYLCNCKSQNFHTWNNRISTQDIMYYKWKYFGPTYVQEIVFWSESNMELWLKICQIYSTQETNIQGWFTL